MERSCFLDFDRRQLLPIRIKLCNQKTETSASWQIVFHSRPNGSPKCNGRLYRKDGIAPERWWDWQTGQRLVERCPAAGRSSVDSHHERHRHRCRSRAVHGAIFNPSAVGSTVGVAASCLRKLHRNHLGRGWSKIWIKLRAQSLPYAIDEADTKWPRIPLRNITQCEKTLRNMGPAHSDTSRGGLMRFASALSFPEQRWGISIMHFRIFAIAALALSSAVPAVAADMTYEPSLYPWRLPSSRWVWLPPR